MVAPVGSWSSFATRKGDVDIRWNLQGFRDLRTDPAVMAKIDEMAQRVAEAASASSGADGFEAQPVYETGGRVRARTAVITTTYEAMRAEAKDHVLLKSLDAAK